MPGVLQHDTGARELHKMQENEHKKEQSSRKQNEMQHKKSFVTRYTRTEMLQKVAQKGARRSVGKFGKCAKMRTKKGISLHDMHERFSGQN